MSIRLSSVRAFTLLEVLIALAIFAVAAVVLGAAYVNVLTAYASIEPRNAYDSEVKFVRAVLLAQADRKKAEKGDDVNLPENRHARWNATIEETDVADLFHVRFTCVIDGSDLAKPFKVDQTFMLLRPTWSDPAVRDKLQQAAAARIQKLNK